MQSVRYAPLYYHHCTRHSAILSVTDRRSRFSPRASHANVVHNVPVLSLVPSRTRRAPVLGERDADSFMCVYCSYLAGCLSHSNVQSAGASPPPQRRLTVRQCGRRGNTESSRAETTRKLRAPLADCSRRTSGSVSREGRACASDWRHLSAGLLVRHGERCR